MVGALEDRAWLAIWGAMFFLSCNGVGDDGKKVIDDRTSLQLGTELLWAFHQTGELLIRFSSEAVYGFGASLAPGCSWERGAAAVAYGGLFNI